MTTLEQTPAAQQADGMGAILEFRGVVKRYGGLKALDGVDLTIPYGALRCLIGANGAGKTTIFKMIMGQESVSKGSVWFKGSNITGLRTSKRARRGLSIKMQIPGVYGNLPVRDNMKIAMAYHVSRAKQDAEMKELLNRVSLVVDPDQLVKNLPHGQVQWLEIAMALAAKPDLLLLDEPTAGMGPGETEITAELVKSLNAEGIALIVIEHDMEFIRMIAKKVTVLHYGKVFTEGTMKEVEANQDVVRIYLGEI